VFGIKLLGLVSLLVNFAAFSQSTNYQLNNYGVNAGGTNSSSSTTYSLNGAAGELGSSASGAATYQTKSGSIEAQQANVPGAPTLSNGSGTYYNKLNFIIDTQNNPSDTTYVIAVATDAGFSSTQYVQADGTLGSSQVFQDYTSWGGGSGTLAIGLSSSTRYWFKMAALQGKFTESAFGPSANEITAAPALSFSLSPSTLNMGNLTAGSVITGPSDISFTFSTNATFGGTVYLAGSNTGLHSAATSHTIDVSPPSGNLTSMNEGFGLQGLTASAPLVIQSPYDGTSNTMGSIYTTFQPLFTSSSAVVGGSATSTVKAKASATTPAANDYSVTLTFVAAASY
jgi:hypothetical protein